MEVIRLFINSGQEEFNKIKNEKQKQKMKKTNLIIIVIVFLAGIFINAKVKEPKNVMYNYMYMIEGPPSGIRSGFLQIITPDTSIIFRSKYVNLQFITLHINKYESEGWELFSYSRDDSDVFIVMRKERE